MKHAFNSSRTQLIISADETERAALRELPADEIPTDRAMRDFLEPLIANSELEWGGSWATSDLTDAPMLWITGEDVTLHDIPKDIFGTVFVGRYGTPPALHYAPILERWAFMDYQVKSVLEELRDKGEVIFSNGL